MQYLLSEEEMAAIAAEREYTSQMPSREALVNVVKHVACHMVDLRPANGHKREDNPHGCIYITPRCHYCDGCPVAEICPMPKEWSK